MKSSDQLMILGYVAIAPHMNAAPAAVFALSAFIASIVLRGFDK